MRRPPEISRVRNYNIPTFADPPGTKGAVVDRSGDKKNLSYFISPVQLQRIRQDIQTWREAIIEAENAWTPHRVKMQQIYNDTILSGHTLACANRRKDLTLLREWSFLDKNGKENKELKELFDKKWFATFLEWALEARFFGYSLIELGNIENDAFPQLGLTRRFNISPDRLNVTSFIYSLSGAQFLEEPYKDWHVWVPTNTDVGISKVGYGLFYNVAVYEIMARNLLGNNADAVELYAMPIRVGKTQKTEEDERAEFMKAMLEMGSAGAILLDTLDELTLVESKSLGQGYKIYPDFEKRLEAKISKILLGHADAMDSIPGKLGNDGEKSPAQEALRDKQASDGAFLEDIVNGVLIPKMINLGFIIDTSFTYKFSNNQEVVEKRMQEDSNNLNTAKIAQTMKSAGLQMDAQYFEKRTGIKTSMIPTPVPQKFSPQVQNRLNKLYSFRHDGTE